MLPQCARNIDPIIEAGSACLIRTPDIPLIASEKMIFWYRVEYRDS